MKGGTLKVRLVSTAIFLTLAPAADALPEWLQPHRRAFDDKFAPRQYNVYEPPPGGYGGSYTYVGYGPQPTITQSSISSSATSESSGEKTSLSSVNYSSKSILQHSQHQVRR